MQRGAPGSATRAARLRRWDAIQAQRRSSSSHTSRPLPHPELAGLRSRIATPRRSHAVGGRSGVGRLARAAPQHAGRTTRRRRPGDRGGAEPASRLPLGPASGGRPGRQRAAPARPRPARAGSHHALAPRSRRCRPPAPVCAPATALSTSCWTARDWSCSAKASGTQPSTAAGSGAG